MHSLMNFYIGVYLCNNCFWERIWNVGAHRWKNYYPQLELEFMPEAECYLYWTCLYSSTVQNLFVSFAQPRRAEARWLLHLATLAISTSAHSWTLTAFKATLVEPLSILLTIPWLFSSLSLSHLLSLPLSSLFFFSIVYFLLLGLQ